MNEEFDLWAAEAGYEVFRDELSMVVASTHGGEIRYSVTRNDDGYTLFRAERAEDPAPELRSTDPVDIERYLTVQLGMTVRSRRDLPRLSFPFEPECTAPGFRFEELEGGWATLVSATGSRIPAELKDSSMHPVVRFSYYAVADPAEIRRSFADPAGAPLFPFAR